MTCRRNRARAWELLDHDAGCMTSTGTGRIMRYPMDEVIRNTLAGIAKAHADYERWTGGDWLFYAPEYLLTTYIAQEIATHRDHGYYLSLEHNARHAIREAGGLRAGRPRQDLRLGGRFDILLWWAKGTPRAIIEVKKHVSAFEHIEEDVSRICSVLKQKKDIRQGIRQGLVAYYTSHDSDSKKLEKFLLRRLEGIETGTREYVEDRELSLKHHRAEINIVDDSGWVAAVLEISRA